MLCYRNINYLRKSLLFSSKHIQSNALYHSSNTFCAMTKLQKPSIIIKEDSIIESIKQKTKSDELTNYLANLNLKKSGNKDDKIRRLIDHFNARIIDQSLNGMNEISLKSYCDLFNISIDQNLSKNELITNLLSVTSAKNDSSNTETVIEPEVNESEPASSFSFQIDQERENQVLERKIEEELQLVEIDEKQSFLHKDPINICSKVTFDNESEIIFETSRIGHLSESAIIVNCKGTIVLTTATSKLQSELKFVDALDLKVDAHERSWSRGYIPSGVQRNDGGITDYEILLCRMIDRSIRPLFIIDDNDSNNKILPAFEVQILSNLLSCDDVYDTQVLSINGASASVYCSPNIDIGNNGPIGAVRVIVDKNDEMICNPTKLQIEDPETKCNLLYVGTNDKCVMIETDANIIDQNKYSQLIQFAQENVTKITEAIKQLKQLKSQNDGNIKELIDLQNENIITKYKKLSEYKSQLLNELIIKQTETELFDLYSSNASKNDRNLKREILSKQMISDLNNKFENGYDISADQTESILTTKEWTEFYKALFYECDCKQFRHAYITNKKRCDGRQFNELRSLKHMIDILPSCHGSSLFQRGDTQTLCSATVGPPRLARMRDMHQSGHPETQQRLYFQYEMPPAATNEIKAIQSKNRRAIGHANIALNALKPLLPSFEEFPYSVRVFSNITASDGSSSMASVCGGSLALMDAGVPLNEPVAGISIGLMNDILLTDIAGIEDHFGDMDFKIAGTKNGITSVQLDIKRGNGIPMDIILNGIKQSYDARIKILESMNQTIYESKNELKKHAPRVDIIEVPFRDIPRVIGSGGAVKKMIQIDTKCDLEINWEQECIEITAPSIIALERAKRAISDVIGSQCRIGDIVTAKIVNIQSYGVMIQIEDGSEHLVHISQWIDNIDDDISKYESGQDIDIMCIGFLGENRPNFSRKAAVWQLSDDPEDRARLRLMLDSLRPPARSRAASSSATNIGSISNGNDEEKIISKREPLSIFSDDNVLDDEEEEEEKWDEEDDDTIPTILPPKAGMMKRYNGNGNGNGNGKGFDVSNNDSIKDLIDNISSNKGGIESHFKGGNVSNNESRFANLYKDVHSDGKSESGSERGGSMSKFSNLMSDIESGSVHSERQQVQMDKNSIEHWKSFTNDLIGTNVNEIEKDDEGDQLLTDLFGDKHKHDGSDNKNINVISSRASKLMDSIPELMEDLNDSNDKENDKENDNEEDTKWPWQQ